MGKVLVIQYTQCLINFPAFLQRLPASVSGKFDKQYEPFSLFIYFANGSFYYLHADVKIAFALSILSDWFEDLKRKKSLGE
jgi:hypothetical protein